MLIKSICQNTCYNCCTFLNFAQFIIYVKYNS